MTDDDLYAVRFGEIDDHILEAMDSNGNERLHFTLYWGQAGDVPLRCRFPLHIHWPEFSHTVYLLLCKLARGDREKIPDDFSTSVFRSDYDNWLNLQAIIINSKGGVAEEMENAFWKFLRPWMDGKTDAEARRWFRENAPFDKPIRILSSLMHPEAFLKKKCQRDLETIYQDYLDLPSKPISEPSSPELSTSEPVRKFA